MDERLRVQVETAFDGMTFRAATVDGLAGVLVLGFAGMYPYGSQGNEHGRWIANTAVEAADIEGVRVIILDLRDFEYQFGNTLLQLWDALWHPMVQEVDVRKPILTITGPKCDAAVRSLLTFGGRPTEPLYDDLDSALAAVEEFLSD